MDITIPWARGFPSWGILVADEGGGGEKLDLTVSFFFKGVFFGHRLRNPAA